MRFKRRPDLIQFSAEQPGALGAQFLCAVSQAVMKGLPKDSHALRDVDVIRWASDFSGLKELRDQREVRTLSHVVARLNANNLQEAIDICSQRIKAICMAKAPKGSWEKAAAVELIPTGGAMVATQSEIALTGLGSA